ncbi:hypothetical protein D3C75_1012570 [compost metagenome]
MQAEHLHQLIPHGLHRVEGRHRLLEDHRDAVAAHLVHLIRCQSEQLLPLKADGARHHLTVGPRQQPHDGQRGNALAAAGLTDYPQGLARGYLEADPVEHLDLAVVDRELHLEIADLEDGGHALAAISGELPPILSNVEDGSLCLCHRLPLLNDAHRSCRSG